MLVFKLSKSMNSICTSRASVDHSLAMLAFIFRLFLTACIVALGAAQSFRCDDDNVESVASQLQTASAASAFCSSVLSYTTSSATTTVTVTPDTRTVTASAEGTVTESVVATATTTSTDTFVRTTTSYSTETCTPEGYGTVKLQHKRVASCTGPVRTIIYTSTRRRSRSSISAMSTHDATAPTTTEMSSRSTSLVPPLASSNTTTTSSILLSTSSSSTAAPLSVSSAACSCLAYPSPNPTTSTVTTTADTILVMYDLLRSCMLLTRTRQL
jgi:hypothetical protein